MGIQNLDGSIGLPYSCNVPSVVAQRAIKYKVRPAVIVNPNIAQQGGAPGAILTYTHTLLNQTGQDTAFTINAISGNWTTTTEPTQTLTVPNGMTAPITITVRIPFSATIGNTDQERVRVSSTITTPATYSTTVLLRSSVSSFGVDFSPPGQTKSGAYGATVTYTMQVINRSPIVNDFTVALLGNSWTTTVSTDTLTNVPPNGSVPIVVSSTVPTLSTLGAKYRLRLRCLAVLRAHRPEAADRHGGGQHHGPVA